MTTEDSTDPDLTVVESFNFAHEAHLVRSALKSIGIKAVIADEHLVSMNWALSQAVGGIKVKVRAADLEKARAFLDERRQNARPCRPTRCDRCGSTNTVRLRTGRGLTIFLWIFAGLPIPLARRLRCLDCGHLRKS